MPFLLRNLTLRPGQDEKRLASMAAGQLKLEPADFLQFRIARKAVDARKKASILMVYTVFFTLENESSFRLQHSETVNLEYIEPELPHSPAKIKITEPVVIAGMGPAGIFCALRLAGYGIKATLLERGKAVEERVKDVACFWKNGILDTESNVQFGEGGAGTFSDGKLTCRLRDPNTAWVLEQLVHFGASPEIRYLARPHIGTDQLRTVVASIRKKLLHEGFSIRFSACLTDLVSANSHLLAVRYNGIEELPCRYLVLATGHSARDTYSFLSGCNLTMERKPFAIGLRVEHPQELIDQIQYGRPYPALPHADYALTYNNKATDRSCYSFCMCPGGVVIGGASETGMVVTNGMSNQRRNSGYANSALVVNVRPEDFGAPDILAGIRFQQHWERLAFNAGGGHYKAPAQNLLSFMGHGRGSRFASSYRPAVVEADLSTVLPWYVTATLREGIAMFDRKMKGFVTSEATLTGVETRTSAPVRILRDENCQSVSISGVYPCGEGAGYAGGIMSAALDGVRIADLIASRHHKSELVHHQ